MSKIFISYRRDDSAYVARMLGEKLQQAFGDEAVFLDIDNIPLGVDFRTHINSAVGESDILLALIGDSWLASKSEGGKRQIDKATDFVRLEIESALERDIPVVPVLVGNAQMPHESELPESLSSLPYRNAAEIRPGRDLKNHINMLVEGLEAHFKPHPESAGKQTEKPRQPPKPLVDRNVASGATDGAPAKSHQPAPSRREGPPKSPYFNLKNFFILAIVGALFLFAATQLRGGDVANFFGFSSFFLFGAAGLILLVMIVRRIFSKQPKK